jgi:hypothetical protein
MEVVFVSCRRQLKYIIYKILHSKERKAMAVESFAIFAPFAVNLILITSPHPFFRSPAAPSRPHSARVPLPICSARPCDEVGGRRFSIIPVE